jgi:ribosome biogenesis GTPase
VSIDQAIIRGVIPRRTVLKRKESGGLGAQVIAANIDAACIVQSIGRDLTINRYERYAAMVTARGVRPIIILNKIDLIPASDLDTLLIDLGARLPGIEALPISTHTGEGMEELMAHLEKAKTYCFLGSSGVGKSSIINHLLGGGSLATGHLGGRSDRGRHVTVARTLFVLDGGAMVIDNPGMRELSIPDSDTGIDEVFDEVIETGKMCKFSDCTHANEPGCAVRAAIASGTLDEKQLENYARLKKENDFHEMNTAQRRQKDRAFGKFLKTAKGHITKYTKDF